MIIALAIYLLCVGAIFYSYVLYPVIVKALGEKRKFSHDCFQQHDSLPPVVIFFAVFNGEKVLREKILSMLNSDYPAHLIRVVVGSDESTDNTDSIVKAIAESDARVELMRFTRRGKANVLNAVREELLKQSLSPDTIFVLTDAYAIFEPTTLFEMVKHFKSPQIGIVGANYINTNLQEGGISHQEKAYIQRENLIKYWESTAFGSMMGVYGACYAIRAVDFPQFPSNILMEDFYVTMLMLQHGKQAILTLDSKFYENIPNSIDIEYNRKRRIAAGNFQNLAYFKMLLNPFRGAVAFTFWSHKVIRWLGPFLIAVAYVCAFMLALSANKIFITLALLHVVAALVPLADNFFKKINVNITLFRFVHYFIRMNMAVLAGWWWYMKGIKTNVWQPTARS